MHLNHLILMCCCVIIFGVEAHVSKICTYKGSLYDVRLNGLTGGCERLANCRLYALDANEQLPSATKTLIAKNLCRGNPKKPREPYACCPVNYLKRKNNTEVTEIYNKMGLQILAKQFATCGQQSQQGNVARGQDADLKEYPWMALLTNGEGGVECGGSLITERHILSAAHCVNTNRIVNVVLGEHTIGTDPDCIEYNKGNEWVKYCLGSIEKFDIAKRSIHKNYGGSHNPIFDIGIITLNRKVEFKDHIKPICLPIKSEWKTKRIESYILAGWGSTNPGVPYSKILQKGILDAIEESICKKKFGDKYLDKVHFCAGNRQLSESCSGDSGGPLFYPVLHEQKELYVQYGIVSGGAYECGSGIPGVYMDVVKFLPWISEQVV